MKIRKLSDLSLSYRAALLAAVLLAAGLTGCGSSKQQVENEMSCRQIGLNQLDKGDYESAINAFNKALNEHTGKVTNLEEDINFYKAYAQIEAGKTEDAIETYTALVEYNKKNADAYYLRGLAYMSIDDPELAVEDFESAVKYKKDSGELYAGIYEQLTSVGMEEEAADYLERGLEIEGDGADACLARGRLYLASGDYDSAMAELKSALKQEETLANLYLGEAASALGSSEEAKGYYDAYIKEHPDDAKVLYELGRIALEEGAYHQALSYFEQGLAGKNIMNKRELWSGKIAALEYTGDFAGAKQEMEAYLLAYPDDEAANREYLFLKTR